MKIYYLQTLCASVISIALSVCDEIHRLARPARLPSADIFTRQPQCSQVSDDMSSGNECATTKCKNNVFQIKLAVIGDGTVGKTCVLVTYKTKEFPEEYVPTVFDNYPCEIDVDDQLFNICLWDTAGSEDYDQIRPLTYPETKCFLLCFAVNDRSSFENIPIKWYPELQKFSRKVPVILVGTKSDLRETDANCISTAEAMKLKKKIKAVKYIECSALKYLNVDHLIQEAVRVVTKQMKPWHISCLKI